MDSPRSDGRDCVHCVHDRKRGRKYLLSNAPDYYQLNLNLVPFGRPDLRILAEPRPLSVGSTNVDKYEVFQIVYRRVFVVFFLFAEGDNGIRVTVYCFPTNGKRETSAVKAASVTNGSVRLRWIIKKAISGFSFF